MNRFARDQLEHFLKALDSHLDEPVELTVIGGSALAIGYDVESVTNDIDTYESNLDVIEIAADAARQATGLAIPIANSTIAQLPPGFEERRRRVLEHLDRIMIFVADPHDLAASKLLRGNDHDRQQLLELHQRHPLDLARLTDCYVSLLDVFVGNDREPRWSFVHFVEEVWGELPAVSLRRLLQL